MIPSMPALVTLREMDTTSLGVSIIVTTTVDIGWGNFLHYIISWAVTWRWRDNPCPWVFRGSRSVVSESTVA